MPGSLIPWGGITSRYERELRALFKIRGPITPEALRRLSETKQFREGSWGIAERMVKSLANANARSWREAAMKSSHAKAIHETLKQELEGTPTGFKMNRIAAENARLIQSLPLDIAEHITAFAARERIKGGRSSEIEAEIRKRSPQLAASRVKLIARTEISRAETELTRIRSEEIGVGWYVWQTSEDARVRKSHRNLDQVLVAWNDPPQPERLVGEKSTLGAAHAGAFPNCRCLALPLVSLDEVKWPCRVYAGGSIQRMSRAQFTRVVGMPIAA